MPLLNSIIMKASAELVYPGFLKMLSQVKQNEKLPYEDRIKIQEKSLRQLIKHAFENIPYYRKLAREIGINYVDIQGISDLPSLPVLTREDVKKHSEDFICRNAKRYKMGCTGGSTGKPLEYLISYESNYRSTALLYNGWNRGGYRLGDKVLMFAGGSLVSNHDIKSKIIDVTRNFHSETSYNITNEKLYRICEYIIERKPLYIRGYASSISILADYFYSHGYKNQSVRSIYTTAEPLLNYQREIIVRAFQVPVFDTYGLNDGGVSAFECSQHNGMHIDTYRSIMEICDENGKPVPPGKEGHIIATDLYNYSFPFIRYDTGDLGVVDDSPCKCGINSPRLIKISGRSADVLTFGNNMISGSGITVLMGKTSTDYYKVVQKDSKKVQMHLLFDNKSNEQIENSIRLITEFFNMNAPEVLLEFYTYSNLSDFPSPPNKHKFIINESR